MDAGGVCVGGEGPGSHGGTRGVLRSHVPPVCPEPCPCISQAFVPRLCLHKSPRKQLHVCPSVGGVFCKPELYHDPGKARWITVML